MEGHRLPFRRVCFLRRIGRLSRERLIWGKVGEGSGFPEEATNKVGPTSNNEEQNGYEDGDCCQVLSIRNIEAKSV